MGKCESSKIFLCQKTQWHQTQLCRGVNWERTDYTKKGTNKPGACRHPHETSWADIFYFHDLICREVYYDTRNSEKLTSNWAIQRKRSSALNFKKGELVEINIICNNASGHTLWGLSGSRPRNNHTSRTQWLKYVLKTACINKNNI